MPWGQPYTNYVIGYYFEICSGSLQQVHVQRVLQPVIVSANSFLIKNNKNSPAVLFMSVLSVSQSCAQNQTGGKTVL